MRRADAIAGLVLAIAGVLALVFLIPSQIDTAPPGMMSPRLVPNLMMIAVTGLSVLLALRNLSGLSGDDPSPVSRAELAALARIGGVFALSIALYHWLSPLAAGIALVTGTLLVLGERRPLVLATMPAALMLVLWVVFYRILGTAIL